MPTCRNLIKAWHHLARFQALRRAHKKRAYQVRQERFDLILTQAQTAADRHDSYQLFQIVNRFSPKLPKRRLQIRNQHGHLATPVEEQAILQDFVQRTWAGPDTVPKPDWVPEGLPFTLEELQQALKEIPISKAVAKPFTPGVIWHAHAELLAGHLYRFLQILWHDSAPAVPACWRDAWLVLIPKPQKRPCSPDALRPLALQEPIGKAIIGLLAKKAQVASLPTMVQFPIWAYLPGRSTQHALLRVALHCAAGRSLVASQHPTVFNRFHQKPMFKICGAVQLFLDISKAFDCVCRRELFGRLHEVIDHPRVIQLLAHWHEFTSYHVEANGSATPVPVGAGVRQGCKAAPWLFNAFVILYLSDLAHLIDWTWLQSHMDVYADDIHACGLFYSICELKRLLYYFGLIIETLQAKGLKVNTTKSAILLTMGGTNFRAARADLTFRTCEGEWIKVHGRTQEFVLPVVRQTKYLGTLISYHQYEDATARHRLTLAQLAFARLKKWLTAKRGLRAHDRLRLWTTCIYPILTYGIFTIGLTKKSLHMIQRAMLSMIRQIFHDHAYITGRSHMQALTHHRVDPPLLWLWRAADSLLQSVTKPAYNALPFDICHDLDWTSVQQVRDFIWHEHASGLTLPGMMMTRDEAHLSDSFQCPHCDFTTTLLPNLRRHLTVEHDQPRFRQHVTNLADFMHDGLPQCKLCHVSFSTWRNFQIHVQRGCQDHSMQSRQTRPLASFGDGPPGAVPPSTIGAAMKLTREELAAIQTHEFGPRLMTLIHQRRWPALLKERAGCSYLSRNCLLCGQYVGRAQAMHHHVRVAHNAISSLVQAKATQLTNLHSAGTPCSACGVTFLSTHSCNVWFQVALLIVHGPKQAITHMDAPSPNLRCEICDQNCATAQELHHHLNQEHKLIGASWHESRDSFQGQPVCSHCHLLFQTMEGLRSHINQGRCMQFNPDLTTAPSEVLQIWKEACCQGRFEDVLAPPSTRMKLTLHCQCCPKRYSRSMDLSAHLQTAHPEIWKAAHPLVFQMMQRYSQELGCTCNPSCNTLRLNHICMPFWQLSMQFMRIPKAIYMPSAQTTADLARILPDYVPVDLRTNLEQALARFDLTQIWTNALLLDALSGSCFFCGHELLPAELTYHLYEAHHGMHPIIKSYVTQLLPHALTHSDNDCACFACGQIFNLPVTDATASRRSTRLKLVQAHLATQCPSVLQLAVLLAHLHHGATRLANGPGRRLAADASDVPKLGPSVGHRPEAEPQSGGTQTPTATGRGPYSKRRRTVSGKAAGAPTGPDQDPDNDGQTLGESRQGPPGPAARDNLHLLFQLQRANRDAAPTPPGGRHMAPELSGECIVIEDAPAPGSPAVGDDHNADTAHEAHGGAGRCTPAPSCTPVAGTLGKPDDSLHGVEPSREAIAGCSQDPSELGENDRALHGTPGGIQRCQPHHEVPCTANETRQRHHTLEVADVSKGGSDLRASPSSDSIPGLDADRHQSEETQPLSELFGSCLGTRHGSEGPQGTGKRLTEGQNQDQAEDGHQAGDVILSQNLMRDILAQMTLANPNNWCFCNAATYCLLWTLLSLNTFTDAVWGKQCIEIQKLMLKARTGLCNLASEAFFRDLMQCWGKEEIGQMSFSISQHDSAEFVQAWLGRLKTPAFAMRWEKRMSLADTTRAMDLSHESFAPPCLKFDATMSLAPFCTLNSLIRTWHQVDGMKTALLEPSACLCLHIDRCVLGSDATVHKSQSKLQVDEECSFPVFANAAIDCDFHPYTVVGLMAHLGSDGAGHYRAAMRVRSMVGSRLNPFQWLVTDDWRCPEPHWTPATWLLENVTMVWLVRSDLLTLHIHKDLPAPDHSSTAELLRMLAATEEAS